MFKPAKHEVIHLLWFKNIQLRNSQQNLNLKIYKPNKNSQFFVVCFDEHRHKQTELEIRSYIFSDHKPGLLLYGKSNLIKERAHLMQLFLWN